MLPQTPIMIIATETVKSMVWYAGDVKQDGTCYPLSGGFVFGGEVSEYRHLS